MRLRTIILGLSLGLLPLLDSAQGSIEALMARAADRLQGDDSPGVAVVAIAKGHIYYVNVGFSDRLGTPVTENTIFETASVSKIFTTTLLGLDVARGAKSLQDPITKYLHRTVRTRMRAATLGMLATYTAGIPTLPPSLRGLPATDWGVDSYPVENFLNYIGHLQPRTALPAPRSYSDASVGVLGLCLGHLSLADWENRLKESLFFPLGMRDTTVELDPEQQTRLAEGEQPDGTIAPPWLTDAFVAADGVKSTTHDLGNFLAAQLGDHPGIPWDIKAGMDIAIKPSFSISNGTILQALAWTWLPGDVHGKPIWVIMKGGNLTGFSSRICFNRNLGVAVAILANRANLPTLDITKGLVERIAEEVHSAASVQSER